MKRATGQYVRTTTLGEEVHASQIEGTQATLTDVFDQEAGFAVDNVDDVEEVTNYLRAFRHVQGQLRSPTGLPLSVRLLCDAHRLLLHEPTPTLPPLVRIALVHAQFETIHPFLDGNGRLDRLLIGALLEQWGLLPEPLLYLSGYLKQHQAEYYRRLSAIRTDGDWEGWAGFFLEGVATAAAEPERGIIAVASLVNTDRRSLLAAPKAGPASYRLFELLPLMPPGRM